MYYEDYKFKSILDFMTLSSKAQDTLHWITVIALWIGFMTPMVLGIVHGHLTGSELVDAVVGTLIAGINKFIYYATTVQGTTPPSNS